VRPSLPARPALVGGAARQNGGHACPRFCIANALGAVWYVPVVVLGPDSAGSGHLVAQKLLSK